MSPTAAYLIQLYQEFPFQEGRLSDIVRRYRGDIDAVPPDAWPRSFRVHLACMVTLAASTLLPKGCNRLGFAYNANAPRSGKTLLLQSAICPIFGWTSGRTWPVGGQGKNHTDEAELRKSIDAAALEGSPYLFYDNIRCQVESQALEAAMTMPIWSGRVMGRNDKTFTAPIRFTVLLTGNDLKLSVDMMERFLMCDLYVEEAEAQARQIENVMEQPWIMEHREEIFAAVDGLITHWDAMGRPPPPNRVRRGFETFGNTIGGIISAAGFGDLFERRPDSDTTGNSIDTDMRKLVHLLIAEMGEELQKPLPTHEFTFEELVNLSYGEGIFSYYYDGGKESIDVSTNKVKFQLTQAGCAKFGNCLKRYAPEKKGRTWELPHNSRIKLTCTGSNRTRRYLATLHLSPLGRIHQLIDRDLTPEGLGLASLDAYLESQGLPLLSICDEREIANILHSWTRIVTTMRRD